ncbi:hypothetical protein [Parerythrobacter jejuensis]|uniref:Uncharacterized protein n=1 Tax=Parerythrobacter jejuensis TaxID=795812 RepID=A0A845AR38_9SPHN|nr:hypothetical protein [Parerythrobacter jejuensis]MXP30582.1 hypothetical protein [Parerythrobacter jejuensis]MXP33342.1 hypothetical protein [Parerythrobacter jejuensis]
MTRVGNTEQVMALVRNQLQRMARREKSEKTQKAGKPEARTLTSRERVQALNAIKDLSEEDFTQSFVRAMLSEEFGEKVSNSPGFQQVIERTASAMRADSEIAALLNRVRGEL